MDEKNSDLKNLIGETTDDEKRITDVLYENVFSDKVRNALIRRHSLTALAARGLSDREILRVFLRDKNEQMIIEAGKILLSRGYAAEKLADNYNRETRSQNSEKEPFFFYKGRLYITQTGANLENGTSPLK